MGQLTRRTAPISWFTIDTYCTCSELKEEFLMCVSLETTKWLMIRKKWITSINKINLCNYIGLLGTDGAPMLCGVRFYNSSEQTCTVHHFYSLCSSSIWTGKISLSRILENSFETRNWTGEFYQAKGLSFQTALYRWIDLSSMLINTLLQIQILQLRVF